LTGQADQLVSALSFFTIGDEDTPPARKGAAARPVRRFQAAPASLAGQRLAQQSPVKPNGHGAAPGAKLAARGGVNLRLKDKQDNLDGEFERY